MQIARIDESRHWQPGAYVVIYIDTSVALAHLLSEDRRPPEKLWEQDLVASRLMEYELWVRINARELTRSHGDLVRLLLARVAFVEMDARVLGRACHPFPMPVRTVDALHLATAAFLRERGHAVEMASYDLRLCKGAEAMGIPLLEMPF
jgi:uncharacterized protein